MITCGEHLRPVLERALDAEFAPGMQFIGEGEACVAGFRYITAQDVEIFLCGRPTRGMLRTCCRYVFDSCNAVRMTACVKAGNACMLALMERLGFTFEGCRRLACDGEDVHMYGMLKEECRWYG